MFLSFLNPFSTFDDKALLKYMKKNKIDYTVDNRGMIDITPQADGYYPPIIADRGAVNLTLLRTSGSIITLADKAKLGALQTVNGNLNAPHVKELFANELAVVTGKINLSQKCKTNMESFSKPEANDPELRFTASFVPVHNP